MSSPAKITEAAQAAIVAENATGVPGALLIAQWALESGWGDYAPGNNCFGIKEYPDCYGRQLLKTGEWFTDAERDQFLAHGDGRKLEPDPFSTAVTSSGRRRYNAWDWFATFPTLAACFEKRAQLFKAGRYKPFADSFAKDGDIEKLIRGIAPIYATAPDYGAMLLKLIGQQNIGSALALARGPAVPEKLA